MLPCSDLVFSASYNQNEKKVRSRENHVDLRQCLDVVSTLEQEFPGVVVIQCMCFSWRRS